MSEALRAVARSIFAEALRAVDVGAAVRANVALQGDLLVLGGRALPLAEVDLVLLVSIGKAAAPMYRAAAQQLRGIPSRAVVVAPESTLPMVKDRDSSTVYLPGAHPTPTQDSLRAASAILHLLADVTGRTAVLFLISGGASAMVERPLSPVVTLDDLAAFSRTLVGSGMGITEMNTLRKHLSAVKGGRLAAIASRARMQCTLLVSDVPAASPDAIASGPSLPDSTTAADTLRLFRKLQQASRVPDSVRAWLEDPLLPETPKAADSTFAHAHWKVILSGDHLAQAAAHAAEVAGFRAVVDDTPDDWEYRDAGRHLLDAAAAAGPGTCLISVGEVNVTIPAQHGEGGRNQQFALWCAAELARGGTQATVLSAGTDGIDGHSSAAGAVCDESTKERAAALGWNVDACLQQFHAAPLLLQVEDAIVTGPTGNNLRDLRLVLLGLTSNSLGL